MRHSASHPNNFAACLLGCVLAFALIIPLQTALAYQAPLQDVTAWAEGNTVHFQVYDPALGKWQEDNRTYSGTLLDLPLVGEGIVGWRVQVPSFHRLYVAVYDPQRESWIASLVGTHWDSSQPVVEGGIIYFSFRDELTSGLAPAVYDPQLGIWKSIRPEFEETDFWTHKNGLMGCYSTIFPDIDSLHLYTYDPVLHEWISYNPPHTDGWISNLILDEYGTAAVSCSSDFRPSWVDHYGYDPHNHKWYKGPTLPLASFQAPEWSNGPTYITDTSIGGGASLFEFSDGTSNNQRSQLHTFSAEGTYTISMTVTNPNGTHSTTRTVTVERTAPTGTIAINDGAEYTAARTVALNLSASDTQSGMGYMRFGNDGATWGAWLQYAESTNYELPAGDGGKTVYVQFKDLAGNISDIYSDTIILDQTPPSDGTLDAAPGINQIFLSWSGFADQLSGIGKYMLYYGAGHTLIYEGNGASFTHRNLDLQANHYYLIQAVDNAGNCSAGISVTANCPINDRWDAGFTGKGLNGKVSALVVDGSGNLYAGGDFTKAGGVTVNYIARWNGAGWSALGSGMNGPVSALAVDSNSALYAGGAFTRAGGIAVNNIAKWNGSSWSALGSGTNGAVNALAVDVTGNLYAGGVFTTAGGISSRRIAKWTGSAWSALGKGMSGTVNALAVDVGGNVYAGGYFTVSGTAASPRIAKWDGGSWSALGSGMNGYVSALAIDDRGNLYAGGVFTLAGGTPSPRIAKWNGTLWSALGSGVAGYVRALAVDDSGNLYAGGDFARAGGIVANNIAKWDGSAWSPLGYGMSATPGDSIYTLCMDTSGSLYAAGQFTEAGGKLSGNIAKWLSQPALAVDFASAGTYLWSGSSNARISAWRPTLLGDWNGRLVASFPSRGLHLHNGSAWTKISSRTTARSVVGIGDSLYVDFGTGIYRYRNGWSRIRSAGAAMMAKYGEKLVASFSGSGLWEYDGSAWNKISTWTTAEQMIGIERRLFVDFGEKGLFRRDVDGSWTKIKSNSPKRMQTFGKSLVASFDSGSAPGLYLYRMNSWTKISSNPAAQGFASNPFALYVDRGTEGIWKYEKESWRQVGTQNPDTMAIYAGKLAADFPGAGVKLYSNPGWSTLSTRKDAGLLQGVFFE